MDPHAVINSASETYPQGILYAFFSKVVAELIFVFVDLMNIRGPIGTIRRAHCSIFHNLKLKPNLGMTSIETSPFFIMTFI
jgi:hypothetical protein